MKSVRELLAAIENQDEDAINSDLLSAAFDELPPGDRVLDEDGINVENGEIRWLDDYYGIYVDDVNGYCVTNRAEISGTHLRLV